MKAPRNNERNSRSTTAVSTSQNNPLRVAHGATAELLVLALPLIGLTVSRMMINFIDTWMVGQLGEAALAAISPSTILLFAISCVGMGMIQSVQTFVSQAEGRGEPHRAGAYVWQSFYIALGSAVITLPVVVTAGSWVDAWGRLADHPSEVRELEIRFLSIALWSIAPATLCVGLESFYNGVRRPRICLYAVLASLVTITIANYMLIFGKFGAPALGIAGSGVATVLSWVVRCAVLCIPLLSRELDERYRIRRNIAPNASTILEIMRIGVPISVQWLVDIGAWVIFLQWMMPPFGAVAMAANTVAIQYMHLAFMPAIGVGMALTTQVGNAIGAGRADEAVLRVRTARRLILAYMGFVALLMIFAGRPLALFFTQDEAVIALSLQVLIAVAAFQLSDGLCITYSFALRGAGDTRWSAIAFVLCCWGIFVAGGIAIGKLAPQFGVFGPWSMCVLYIVVLGWLLWARFRGGKWRRIRIFNRDPAAMPAGVPAAAAGEPALVSGSARE